MLFFCLKQNNMLSFTRTSEKDIVLGHVDDGARMAVAPVTKPVKELPPALALLGD